MTAPPQQQAQLTLFHCLGCIAAVTGAAAGSLWGVREYGVWGAALGVPVGMVAGVVGLWALIVGCVLTVAPITILFNYGPRKLWEFVRGRWEPPDWQPITPPADGDQPNSSGG